MKHVGDILAIDGKKYEVTYVSGDNYSYKPYVETAVQPEETKTETTEVKHRRRKTNV